MGKSKPRETTRKAIVSAVLENGGLVEAIFRPEQHQTALLLFQDGRLEEHQTLDLPKLGSTRPYAPDNNLLTHRVLLLPSSAQAYESEADLLESVRAFIHRYAELSEWFEEVATHFVLLTWIYDVFNEVPYLRLKGDFGSGKSRCLQTIGSLCYKPMFTSGASTISPLFRIIDAFRGTLIIDESDFRFSDERADIVKILNNGNAVGFPILRSEVTPQKEFNPTAFNVFGPKLIATRKSFQDEALESRCITESLSGLPPRRGIPLTLPRSFDLEATRLRNQLLMYRFRNRHRRLTKTLKDARVEPRIAQMLSPLLVVAESQEARVRLKAVAREKSGLLNAQRSATLEAQLLDIMFNMRRESAPLSVQGIARRFAEAFGTDYSRPITPRWIGAQLRGRLSITSMKSHGVFVVPETEYGKLDRLGRRYGVTIGKANQEASGIPEDVEGRSGDVPA